MANEAQIRIQLKIQQLLQTHFSEAKSKNPQYSMRSFARRLGISIGTLSLVLSGQRKISLELVEKIAQGLLLDPLEKAQLDQSFINEGLRSFQKAPVANTSNPAETKDWETALKLTADQYFVLSEWIYFALLNLLRIRGFKNDPKWIAARLQVPVGSVGPALERLERLGFIEKNSRGSLVRKSPAYRTSDDIANASVRRSHFQTLELAKKSLEVDAIEERDFTWITLALDSKKIPEAKILIRKFQDEFLEKITNGSEPNEVYRLGMHLIPLSKKERKK